MKKTSKLIMIFLSVMLLSISCTRVAPNYAGVLMENYGKSGKSDYSIVSGRVSTIAPGTELFQTPLWEQRAEYETKSTLKDADNTELYVTPKYSYKIQKDKVVDLVFNNSNLGSGNTFMKALEDNVLEARSYDIIKEEAKASPTDSLMQKGGNLKFEKIIQSKVYEAFNNIGVTLMTFSTNLDYGDKVKKKIENRNEVNTNVTVIDQQIIEQRKINELEELRAQQNVIRSRGITDEILKQQALEKWDGVLPSTVAGNQGSIMNIPLK